MRMHMVENVYFNMAKEATTFALWEKLQSIYEKKSSSKLKSSMRNLVDTTSPTR